MLLSHDLAPMSNLPRLAFGLYRLQRCFTCRRQRVWSIPTSSRSISTTFIRSAPVATKPAAHPTVVLSSPSPEYLAKEELDAEVLPQQDISLIITDRAAQVMPFLS